ncbi:MAG: hypothetical protein LBE22_09250, partial [Azoarcus sp.]|nr:hypothetical protein [Azoarcus sp.]
MSGVKVVRVLTREERMAPSLKLLKTLGREIARYDTQCAAQDELQQELKATRARFEALAQEVQEANWFDTLEDSLRAEIAFVQEKRERARQAQLEKLSLARLQQYLKQYLQAQLQEAVAQQRAHYADEQGAKDLTETQRALLQQMRDVSDEASGEEQAISWEAMLAAIPEPVSRLERTMAALELLHPALAESFGARLAELHTQSLTQTAHNMARDTLYMELAEAVKTQQEIRQAVEALEDIVSQAEFPPPVMAAIEHAIAARDLASLLRLRDQISTHIETREAETFARLRREALLEGLAELGYTPGENMDALLEKEGRIVLRNNRQTGYGVELAASSSPRVQLRVVSLSDRHNAEADHEAESALCQDVEVLQEKARARGMDIALEISKKPGEVPVKRLARQLSAIAPPKRIS